MTGVYQNELKRGLKTSISSWMYNLSIYFNCIVILIKRGLKTSISSWMYNLSIYFDCILILTNVSYSV